MVYWFKRFVKKHKDIKIKQRYCFLITRDLKIIIVSKNGEDWQFPGGHPKIGEGWKETLVREIYEETGFNISCHINEVKKLGYYLNNMDGEEFLQERYYLILPRKSAELELQPCENEEDDTVTIKFVKVVSFDELKDYVSWIKDSDAWAEMLKLLPPKKFDNDYV